MTKLKNQVAIVTGSSTGIGRSVALGLAAEGARVVLAARRRELLEKVAKEVEAIGADARVVPTDVTSEADVVQLFEKAIEDFGQVDILVNNAGISTATPTDELSLETWKNVIDVNITGAFLASREALKVMKPRRRGRIIDIGSVSAKMPRFHSAPYTTSKFALEGLTRCLALDGREHGISASIVQPGNTRTDLWSSRQELAEKEGLMSAEDLARVVVLMATLPPEVNLLEGIVLPVSMPFLGRG